MSRVFLLHLGYIFSPGYVLRKVCQRRCSVSLHRALVSWSAYMCLRLSLNFQFCLSGLHLVLLWVLHGSASYLVISGWLRWILRWMPVDGVSKTWLHFDIHPILAWLKLAIELRFKFAAGCASAIFSWREPMRGKVFLYDMFPRTFVFSSLLKRDCLLHGHISFMATSSGVHWQSQWRLTMKHCQSTPPRQTLNENNMLKIIVIVYYLVFWTF